jgi:hypothetical protein
MLAAFTGETGSPEVITVDGIVLSRVPSEQGSKTLAEREWHGCSSGCPDGCTNMAASISAFDISSISSPVQQFEN